MSPYIRTVKTASDATAVQIVHSNRRGSKEIEHIGSAHSPAEVELLKAAARQRLHVNQAPLDFGEPDDDDDGLPVLSSHAKHLWDALTHAYAAVRFDQACAGDEVFKQLVFARVVEPTSKADSIRVLTELGVQPPSYPTINRRLPGYATPQWRSQLAGHALLMLGWGLRRWSCMT